MEPDAQQKSRGERGVRGEERDGLERLGPGEYARRDDGGREDRAFRDQPAENAGRECSRSGTHAGTTVVIGRPVAKGPGSW